MAVAVEAVEGESLLPTTIAASGAVEMPEILTPSPIPFLAYHGTSARNATMIANNGFIAGEDGVVYFAEESHTAKWFAETEYAGENPVLMMFKMNNQTAESIGFERDVLGAERDAMNPDIPNGSGYELKLRGNSIDKFNEAWSNGQISSRTVRTGY